ncbi:MAG TPA: sugar transferase, partial [Gemmatimonadaceae bacterium]|nr:sugar transferase [Gemmatimonadaceae bacterium]
MNLRDMHSRITPRGVPRTRRTSGEVIDVTERIRSIDVGRLADVAEGGVEPHVVPATRSEQVSRVVNVVVAAVAIALVAPLMLVIALAVRLTSHGPILYMQTRVGLDRRQTLVNALYDRRMQDLGGRIFTIYKFRTMNMDAESGSGAVWASKSDPR